MAPVWGPCRTTASFILFYFILFYFLVWYWGLGKLFRTTYVYILLFQYSRYNRAVGLSFKKPLIFLICVIFCSFGLCNILRKPTLKLSNTLAAVRDTTNLRIPETWPRVFPTSNSTLLFDPSILFRSYIHQSQAAQSEPVRGRVYSLQMGTRPVFRS